jgi:hypothetical protein
MVERTWIAADMMNPPFVNQLVLEGHPEADALDARVWEAAVREVASAQPGCRLRLRGHLKWASWVADGPVPPVRVVDGRAWSGLDAEGAPFLSERLPYRLGPTAELLLVTGRPGRVVVRTHHATMDGGGTLTFVEDLFRALRGEPPLGAPVTDCTDETLARRVPGLRPLPLTPADAPSLLGPATPAPFRTTWRRLRVPGRPSKLLGRVAMALLGAAGEYGRGRVPVGVPVDMRQFHPEIRSNANLTGMVRLELGAFRDRPGAESAIMEEVRRLLAAREDARNVVGMGFLRWTALYGMKVVGTLLSKANLRKDRYDTVAVISNLGRLPLNRYVGAGFQARRGFFIPPSNPALPLFLAMSGGPEGVEVCVTTGLGHCSGGRFDAFMERLAQELEMPTE